MSLCLPKDDASKWAFLGLARFVLAFVVMTGHIGDAIAMGHGWTRWGLWLNQGSAVFGFLLISGYSIAASLEKSPKGFYLRRVWRILPVYFLAIIFALVVVVICGNLIVLPNGNVLSMPSVAQIAAMLFMLQGFLVAPMSIDGPLWTLAVEWWNYMGAPLLQKLSSFLIILALAASLTCDLYEHPGDVSKLEHGRAFLCISWYWLVGFLYYRHRRTPIGYALLFFPVLFAYSSGVFVGRAVIIGLMAVALGDEVKLTPVWTKRLNWLGDISYPLYAFQIPVMILCTFCHITITLVICCLTIGFAAFVHQWVEVPLHTWSAQKAWFGYNKKVTKNVLNSISISSAG